VNALILHRASLAQTQGAGGEAVYAYREPPATQRMRQNRATAFRGEHRRFCVLSSKQVWLNTAVAQKNVLRATCIEKIGVTLMFVQN